MRTQGSTNDARETLLSQTMEHLFAHGLGDLSLRQLAAAIGTSHRMLIYHFGSKEKLLVEVVRAVELRERSILESVIDGGDADANAGTSPADTLREIWEYSTRPHFAGYLRLFFELYGQALQGRPHTAELLDGVVETMHMPLTQLFARHGATPTEAQDEGRLALATLRGLFLDLLATGDERAVGRAFARYVARYEQAPPTG